jgi:hypothetical protein
MKSRDDQVREIATDLKIRACICALRRLAAETSALYAELIAHKTPPEVARGYFIINMLIARCARWHSI